MNAQLVGIVSSVLTAVSMLPQLIKVIREKDAENVSIVMLSVLLAGLAMWIYYGVLIKDLIIIVSNSFSVLLNVVLLFCAFRFKK
jgi:MtN3 and saliva related transmembrane protein